VIYLPVMYTLVRGAESFMALARMRGAPPWAWRSYQAVLWIVLAGAVAGVIHSVGSA